MNTDRAQHDDALLGDHLLTDDRQLGSAQFDRQPLSLHATDVAEERLAGLKKANIRRVVADRRKGARFSNIETASHAKMFIVHRRFCQMDIDLLSSSDEVFLLGSELMRGGAAIGVDADNDPFPSFADETAFPI